MKIFLSVVIPSYNESANVKRHVLDEVLNYLKKQDYEWEILLTDDGSTDDTVVELKKFARENKHVQVLENVHAGKGPTVQSGMLGASGEWILFTDFDQSTPLAEIEKLWPYKDSHQVIIGSREIKGAKRDKEPLHRHLMGKGFNFLVQLLAIPGIADTQCGFKMFQKETGHQIFSKLVVYGRKGERSDAFTGAFDVEALFLAKKMGLKIKEVPIVWHHNKTNRISPVKDSLRMLRDIIRIRLTDLLGKYALK